MGSQSCPTCRGGSFLFLECAQGSDSVTPALIGHFESSLQYSRGHVSETSTSQQHLQLYQIIACNTRQSTSWVNTYPRSHLPRCRQNPGTSVLVAEKRQTARGLSLHHGLSRLRLAYLLSNILCHQILMHQLAMDGATTPAAGPASETDGFNPSTSDNKTVPPDWNHIMQSYDQEYKSQISSIEDLMQRYDVSFAHVIQ